MIGQNQLCNSKIRKFQKLLCGHGRGPYGRNSIVDFIVRCRENKDINIILRWLNY